MGEFIEGEIADIEYDMEHKFKGFQGAEDSIREAVRFVFKLNGYAFKHYTRWMTFSYGDRANLFNKYILKLVDGAIPDFDFD